MFGQKRLYSGKSGCLPANWLYSGKVVLFHQGACKWEKVVVFGQEWLYSGRVVVFGKKEVVFEQSGFNWTKLFYSGNVVVFG